MVGLIIIEGRPPRLSVAIGPRYVRDGRVQADVSFHVIKHVNVIMQFKFKSMCARID